MDFTEGISVNGQTRLLPMTQRCIENGNGLRSTELTGLKPLLFELIVTALFTATAQLFHQSLIFRP